jgi:hypothetical protein
MEGRNGAPSLMRLVVLMLIALALSLLPILAGDHHAQAHAGEHGIEHQLVEAPCAQDHGNVPDCAALGGCPVCVIRGQFDGPAVMPEGFDWTSPATAVAFGHSPAPDIHPPRSSVAV